MLKLLLMLEEKVELNVSNNDFKRFCQWDGVCMILPFYVSLLFLLEKQISI
jgi:hypothetical protein